MIGLIQVGVNGVAPRSDLNCHPPIMLTPYGKQWVVLDSIRETTYQMRLKTEMICIYLDEYSSNISQDIVRFLVFTNQSITKQ